MLLREEANGGVLAIAQVVHSELAGRLASVWSERPPALSDGWSELCLAAAIHDLAWNGWDAAPGRDPATGLPFTFRDLPDEQWAATWADASVLAAPYGRAVELWILRHAARLMRSERTGAIHATRTAILARLADVEAAVGADPVLALDADAITAGTQLLARWDGLSLTLCHGVRQPVEVGGYALTPGPAGDTVHLAPWPLTEPRVVLRADARRLPGPTADQAALDATWAAAPIRTLTITLLPG